MILGSICRLRLLTWSASTLICARRSYFTVRWHLPAHFDLLTSTKEAQSANIHHVVCRLGQSLGSASATHLASDFADASVALLLYLCMCMFMKAAYAAVSIRVISDFLMQI